MAAEADVLFLYVWGDNVTKTCPVAVQYNCNAKSISRKPRFNLRDVDGRDKIMQNHIRASNRFDSFMSLLRTKVFQNGLRIIGINCAQGRHRSAGLALIFAQETSAQGLATIVSFRGKLKSKPIKFEAASSPQKRSCKNMTIYLLSNDVELAVNVERMQ